MGPATTLQDFPTFVAWYRRLVRITRAMAQAGVWLSPRVATTLVLVMCCELVWVVAMPEPPPRFTVPAVVQLQTLVLYFPKAPPPWPRGNCFILSSKGRWLGPVRGFGRMEGAVCNMHAENFSAIVGRLNLKAVEIQPVDERSWLITDRRIPREWLLQQPCPTCFREQERRDLLRRFSEHFSTPPSP
jgi:hypothetical protein